MGILRSAFTLGFSLVFNFCVKVVDLQTRTDQKHPKTAAGGAILGSIHRIFHFSQRLMPTDSMAVGILKGP